MLTAPAVVGNYLVLGDYAGYVHWLMAAEGTLVARQQLDKKGIQAAPIVYGNTVYIQGAGGTLAAYRLVVATPSEQTAIAPQ